MKVGFIGLGVMGSGMVVNLLKHHFELVVLDVDTKKVKQAVAFGANSAKTPQEIVTTCEVILLCLPHPDISRDVLFGENGISKGNINGKTMIETSTLTPEDTVDFFKKLNALRANYLCTPMLAGSTKAHAGEIHFLVEGEKSILEKYRKIFVAMGDKITYLGLPPQATLAKLARNICRYANVVAALEVISFLRSYTTDIKPIYDVLVDESHTNFDEVWAGVIKPVALQDAQYQASQISVKDLGLILDRAHKKQVAMPVTDKILEVHKKYLGGTIAPSENSVSSGSCMHISHVWLYAKDMGVSLRWYRDVLGLSVVETFPDGALFQAGEVLLGIHREEGERKARPGSTIVILNVVDIEATYAILGAKGVVFAGSIRDEPYGRIVEFRDPDGYVFEIVQEPK